MRCLTAHRGDVYLAMRGPDSARVNSVSSPRRLRSLTTHRRPIPPHSPRSIPDFYQARDKPIPIGSYKRLPASSCIGNAPAINSTLLLSTTAPSHSRYNTNDISGAPPGAEYCPHGKPYGVTEDLLVVGPHLIVGRYPFRLMRPALALQLGLELSTEWRLPCDCGEPRRSFGWLGPSLCWH